MNPPVAVRNSEHFAVTSIANGESYHVFIQLPASYHNSDKQYPVLYMPDGDQFFGMVCDTAYLLSHRDGVPEMIIVAVGYGSEVPAHFQQRIRDLSPTPIEQFPGSGGGVQFMSFWVDQLIPHIETNYRVDAKERTFLGASISGLFALSLIFEHPSLFQRCVVSSPSFFWDDQWLLRREAEFAVQHTSFPLRLFLSIAELEEQDHDFNRFREALERRNYEGFRLQSAVISGETHFSVQPAAFAKGLKAIFDNGAI